MPRQQTEWERMTPRERRDFVLEGLFYIGAVLAAGVGYLLAQRIGWIP